ncbi:RING finger protein [Halalkalicoccus jeotgali]|uniref:Uncharacterized protein n=1 Tax=Halalkalicoccus jeotgali (strain DSM 18796 / CECT 7217 / JCM 14584 / KCTC 4019 / B3) TaxID=795797 RepID=D8J9F9_HALJB|nr:hypothetical protein [Halalkalicoccus jeotgali]ADJ14371.1 hypothetical protein HacjB3_04900 [Halalkalicoccus jeotgali B3]ELY40632.1 hypothetical protein C497_03277 [Halalkalicoccus jeotgali B3]
MNVRFCPDCVSRGVDCPLMMSGECTHCGRYDAPVSRQVADYEYRLRFAWDSFRFRLGIPAATLRARSALMRFLAFRR